MGRNSSSCWFEAQDHFDVATATLHGTMELARWRRGILRAGLAAGAAGLDATRRVLTSGTDVATGRVDTKQHGVGVLARRRPEQGESPCRRRVLDGGGVAEAVDQRYVHHVVPLRVVDVDLGLGGAATLAI